jgi:hypothetical protein
VLVRGPSARLLGLDPRTALAVDDLPPPLAGMLDELAAPTERVGLVARAVQRGADRDEAEELLRRLVDTGVLVDAEGPERVARQRAAAAVTVVGGGPLAAGVAAGLGRAGIGAVWVEAAADGVVQEGDLGTGLLDTDRGRSALEAVVDVVRRVAPGRASGRPRPAPRRTCVCLPTPSCPIPRGSPPCTATASRTCPSVCATASESSGRSCFRVARRVSGVSSCTGAAATPAGRRSRPSSSDATAEAMPPRRWPPRR